ncbi:VOC family protein [Acinetobacter guerrae]|uniref:VOC family protein n=2 Tax=Acinetobacter guerrae TaxID=1843371 RepID=A0A3A8EHD1_9GAMM|nr:VOC family protein [Acinetobacter guerrae]MPW45923.1 glyoxalase [Acinetobacter guerrae]RKG32886.1 VOC family protein [Acinetobacter guerrae]
MTVPVLHTIMIYAKDMHRLAHFYKTYFSFEGDCEIKDGLIELHSADNGLIILIHQAAKSIKMGQANIKLVFSVENVDLFKQNCLSNGLFFGVTHQANGYQFANVKDPEGNSVSISSRSYQSS